MQIFWGSVLAFFIASLLCISDLISGKYPQTYLLLFPKSRALYSYAGMYGLLAALAVPIFSGMVTAGQFRIPNLDLSNIWLLAILVGLTIRALFHIRLLSIMVGTEPLPIGSETFVSPLESSLLLTVSIDEYNAVMDYIQPRINKYTDLATVKDMAVRNLPRSLNHSLVASLEGDISKAQHTDDVLFLYISSLGIRSFNRVFPP